MKKFLFVAFLSVSLVGLLVVGCDTGNGGTDGGVSGGGKLTVTGLETINGKYVILDGSQSGGLFGAISNNGNAIGVLVSNGRAEFKVYKGSSSGGKNVFTEYSGSDSNINFSIYWKNSNDFTGWQTGSISGMTKFGAVTVTFTNGTATGTASTQ